MKKLFTLSLVAVAMALGSCCGQKKAVSPFEKKSADCMATLLAWRDFKTGIWESAGWWNSANILTCVIRYSEITGSDEFYPVIDDLFERARHYYVAEEPPRESWYADNFIGTYYDDEGWWALAWVDAYNLTGKQAYLETAEIIFADLTTSWDEVCDGGIYWKKGEQKVYKNSISTTLFTLSAARLYKATGDESYREWFEKGVQWIADKKLIDEKTFYVEDGLNSDCLSDEAGYYFTYNQGIPIGYLVEMYELTKEDRFLEQAENIADATIEGIFVTEDGILRERNPDIERSGDGVQFKGAFIRNFARLYEVTRNPKYKDFIIRNAESIIANNYDPASRSFGFLWYGPFEGPNTAANSSALECVIEAYALTK